MTHSDILRIGCAAGFSGDRTDAAGAGGRRAARQRRPGRADLRDAGRAHAGAGAAGAPRRPRRPATSRCSTSCCGRCSARCLRARHPHRQQLRRRQPAGAARRIAALARELGLRAPRIAVVAGDDLSGAAHRAAAARARSAPRSTACEIVSANAYLGAEAIADALRAGAEIVVCGRVADPSLTVGPALAHFGWARDDWDRLARATMAGHLLECGAQVSGGYYADPGFKDVPGLATPRLPDRRDRRRRPLRHHQAAGTGGRIDAHTVKEQLLYEVHDPARLPDARRRRRHRRRRRSTELGRRPRAPDRRARPSRGPATLKVNVCHESGWLAEGEISYAGAARRGARAAGRRRAARAPARARAAARRPDRRGQRVRRRRRPLARRSASRRRARRAPARGAEPRRPRAAAERLAREVTALYTCGPAGGGGVRTALRAAARHGLVPACRASTCRRTLRVRSTEEPRMNATLTVPLYRAAHGRTGDKGNRSNISVIAWHPALWHAAGRAGHRSRGRARSSRTAGPARVHALPAAEAARDELRARRRARRRRQRCAQPRQPRQGAVVPAARPAASTCRPSWPHCSPARPDRTRTRPTTPGDRP